MKRRIVKIGLEFLIFAAVAVVASLGGKTVAWVIQADAHVSYQSATYELTDGTIIEARTPEEVERIGNKHRGKIKNGRLKGMFSEKLQVTGLSTMTFTFVLIAGWAMFRHRGSLRTWFVPSWPAVRLGLFAVGGMEVAKISWGLLLTALGVSLPSTYDVSAWGPIGFPVLLIVMMGIVGPIAEEIYFRGRLLDLLRDSFSNRMALIVTSVTFAALHPPGWFTPLFLLFGLSLAYLRVRTGGLVAPIVAHMVFNMIAVIRILLANPTA